MRKFCLLVVTIVLLSVILISCQSNSDNEFSKISISNSSGFGKINPDFFKVYEDEDTLITFQKMISSAVKQEGAVDMAEPEFDLEVIYKDGNKQGYHLWVGEEGEKSTLMKVENTHTIYTLSEEITAQLIDLVK